MSPSDRLQILVLLEAARLNGPAKNLLYALQYLPNYYSVAFAVFSRNGGSPTEFHQALESAGYRVLVIRERFRWDPIAAFDLFRAIGFWKPNVVQVHNTKSRLFVLLGRLTGCVKKVPLVFCFHGETAVNKLQLIYNALDRRLYRFADRVLVVDESQVSVVKAWGVREGAIRLVPNAIPSHENRRWYRKARLTIVCISRLSYEKGVDLLLEAIRIVGQLQPGAFNVKVFGEGPEESRLRELSRSLGIAEAVQFMGHCTDHEQLYQSADLVVIPSRSEGMPNVLLEATARGIPVVATKVGGIPQIVRDGDTGMLVPVGDIAKLANAMVAVLRDPEQAFAMAEKAREEVLSTRSPQRKADQLSDLWKEVASQSEE